MPTSLLQDSKYFPCLLLPQSYQCSIQKTKVPIDFFLSAFLADTLLKCHLNFKVYYTIYILKSIFCSPSAQPIPPTVHVLMISAAILADNEYFVLNSYLHQERGGFIRESRLFIFTIKFIVLILKIQLFLFYVCVLASIYVCTAHE